jgi:hypothetical protein
MLKIMFSLTEHGRTNVNGLVVEYLSWASAALLIGVQAFAHGDRWYVQRFGERGVALITESELAQTLPRKVWRVKLQVIPQDKTCGSFRTEALWQDAKFDPQSHQEESPVAVRFRRAPRPIVMPSLR